MYFTKKEKILYAVGYAVFMLLFYFIGIPKMSFLDGLVSFLVVSAFYVGAAYAFKKFRDR